MDLKLLQKRIIQKTEEATGDLISNKIPKKKKKKNLRTSMQNTSGTERNEAGDLRFDTETTKKICISPEKNTTKYQ